jgi:hypothetical protein
VTGGVILAAYALAAGYGAPAVLSRDWARRSPRIAIGLWLTVAVSWLAAVPAGRRGPRGAADLAGGRDPSAAPEQGQPPCRHAPGHRRHRAGVLAPGARAGPRPARPPRPCRIPGRSGPPGPGAGGRDHRRRRACRGLPAARTPPGGNHHQRAVPAQPRPAAGRTRPRARPPARPSPPDAGRRRGARPRVPGHAATRPRVSRTRRARRDDRRRPRRPPARRGRPRRRAGHPRRRRQPQHRAGGPSWRPGNALDSHCWGQIRRV